MKENKYLKNNLYYNYYEDVVLLKNFRTSGVIFYNDLEFRFFYENMMLNLVDKYIFENLKDQYPLQEEKNIDVFYGKLDNNSYIIFLDNTLVNCVSQEKYISKLIIISDSEINNESKFDSLRLIGGTLNTIGNPIQEVMKQKSFEELKDTAKSIKLGKVTYETKSFSETNISFYSPDSTQFTISMGRTTDISKFPSNAMSRTFIATDPNKIQPKKIVNLLDEMVSFITFINLDSDIYFDEIILTTTNIELGYNTKHTVIGNFMQTEKSRVKQFSFKLLEDNKNSLGNLYTFTHELSHLNDFIFPSETYKSFSPIDIFRIAIGFEQITETLGYKQEYRKISDDLNNMIDEFFVSLESKIKIKELSSFKNHVNFFGNKTIDGIANSFLKSEKEIREGLYDHFRLDKKKVNNHLEQIRMFRNSAAHSGNFLTYFNTNLAISAHILLYILYSMILLKSGYEKEKVIQLVYQIINLK